VTPLLPQVIVNDLDVTAVAAARKNVEYNGLTLDQVRCTVRLEGD
jgi:ribosomal protein L11 methylase PrmA